MNSLLDLLGRDAVPPIVIKRFVTWCVVEQAQPALVIVLQKVGLEQIAAQLAQTRDRATLTQLAEEAHRQTKILGTRARTGPLGMSAAEAASYEFNNLLNASQEEPVDAEGAAFFAARVCGWAGWAGSDFADPRLKVSAEAEAKEQQAITLQSLLRNESSK